MSESQLFSSTKFPGREYREKRILGYGGESIVYLVEGFQNDVSLGEFALKHLSRVVRDSPKGIRTMKRFERQISIMQNLKHPAIVRLVDEGDPFSRFVEPFIVMEYAPGENLRQALRTRLLDSGEEEGVALPLGEIMRIMTPIVDAIGYAHCQNIAHRDLKPENIMVQGPKLLDFGAAKPIVQNGAHETVLTSGGASYQYCAPEQFGYADENFSPATDVYTLNVLFYELLTGSPLPRRFEDHHHEIPNSTNLGRFRDIITRGISWEAKERPRLEELAQMIKGEKGDGIAKKDGFVFFVPNTREGERIRVRVDTVAAEFKEAQQPPTTTLAKPTGALVPMEISLTKQDEIDWKYVLSRFIPVGGATYAGSLALVPGLIASNNAAVLLLPGASVAAVGQLIYLIFKGNKRGEKRAQEYALAAPDESYKERGLVQRVLESNQHIPWLPLTSTIAGAALLGTAASEAFSSELLAWGALFTGMYAGYKSASAFVKPALKRKKFRKDYNNLLEAPHTVDIEAVLQQVEEGYSPKARRTLAHNYAHKMLEEGKYDEVVRVADVSLRRRLHKEGRFARWRIARQERKLLENICFGLLRKGAITNLAKIKKYQTLPDILGKKKTAAINNLARDRLREVHHNLYGRKEDDAEVQQYVALCRTFGMEPNLEKLTHALVPAPMEEARGVPIPRIVTITDYERDLRYLRRHATVTNALEKLETEKGWEERQKQARIYALEELAGGRYQNVAHVVEFARVQQIEMIEGEENWATTEGIARRRESGHIEELLYGLLNKGAWNDLANIRSKQIQKGKTMATNLIFTEPYSTQRTYTFTDLLGKKQADKFDAAVKKRLEEVRPHLSKASMTELADYKAACHAFDYKQGLQEAEGEQTLRTAPVRENW